MEPFSTTRLNYNPENFFPRINQEYRDFVRKGFLLEEIRDEDKFSKSDYYDAGVEDPFDVETPSYRSEGIDDIKAVIRGQKWDVVSTLSSLVDHLVRCVSRGTDNNYNNDCEFVDVGVEESLNGKSYVLLVCVFVPAKWCELNATTELLQLSIISSELSSQDDFEMVFVPMMRRKPDSSGFYGADDFERFFTAFPNRLAVPVSCQRACDIMCRKLNFNGVLQAMLVGPNHEVLPAISYSVCCYGSNGYPFTPDRHDQLWKEPPKLSLARLLGLDPTSCLRKLGSVSSETVSIDHLSTKLVGLYLYRRGDMFRAVNEVYQQYRDRLEIVLVCMPPCNSINPFVFQEEAHSILKELGLGMSWWVFPYDNSACCRLSRLSDRAPLDDMIMVDPSTGLPDPYGVEILNYWGSDAYPFTREALVQRYVDKAEQVTLQSLLCRESVDYVIKPDGGRTYVAELEGKYVFLCVDWYLSPGFSYDILNILNKLYHGVKEHHSESDFEFVFVPCKASEDFPPDSEIPQYEDIPWSIYPSDVGHSAFLRTHDSFFMEVSYRGLVVNGLRPPALLVFGKDGCIHLLDGIQHVLQYGAEIDPLLPSFRNLRSQVIQSMRSRLGFMHRYN